MAYGLRRRTGGWQEDEDDDAWSYSLLSPILFSHFFLLSSTHRSPSSTGLEVRQQTEQSDPQLMDEDA